MPITFLPKSSTQLLGYKVYSALISQSGTSDPTVIVLKNTIGNIVWSYSDVGDYIGTLAGAFTANKTMCFYGSILGRFMYIEVMSTDTLELSTANITNTPTNSLLNSQSIEIRVYN